MSSIFPLLIPIIFVAIAYSLNQNKKAQSDQSGEQKKYPMPPIGKQWGANFSQRVEEEPSPQIGQSIKERERRFTESVNRQTKEMEQDAEDVMMRPSLKTASRNISHHDKQKKDQTKPSLQLDSDSIAQGVLLAEILGPPRARNPHPAIMKRRQTH